MQPCVIDDCLIARLAHPFIAHNMESFFNSHTQVFNNKTPGDYNIVCKENDISFLFDFQRNKMYYLDST